MKTAKSPIVTTEPATPVTPATPTETPISRKDLDSLTISNLPLNITVSDLPVVATDFQPLNRSALAHLLKIEDLQEAEVTIALTEIGGKGPALRDDLGSLAPDYRLAVVIQQNVLTTRAAAASAARVLAYCDDRAAYAEHDAMTFLNNLHEDVVSALRRKPTVDQSYPDLMKIYVQKSAAISAGRAAKAAEAEAEVQDPEKTDAEPEADVDAKAGAEGKATGDKKK